VLSTHRGCPLLIKDLGLLQLLVELSLGGELQNEVDTVLQEDTGKGARNPNSAPLSHKSNVMREWVLHGRACTSWRQRQRDNESHSAPMTRFVDARGGAVPLPLLLTSS